VSIALDNFQRLLTRPEAAAWLRERYHVGSKSWLAALSVKGQGPVFAIVGKHALYHPNDLAQWVQERFLSAKAAKHSAASQDHVLLSAEPIRGLPSDELSPDEPSGQDYIPGIDIDAIEKGLRLVAQLGG
jgi:hypothetical protein